jgi:amino acid transporter
VRIAVLTVTLAGFAAVNYRGAQGGARLSSFFTVAKLVPLAVFVLAGVVFLVLRGAITSPPAVAAPLNDWLRALMLIGFAYGGFDGAVLAMGEARDPRRDVPFALVLAMLFLAALYTIIQALVNAALPDPAATARPLADAAAVFLGTPGSRLLAAGALVSLVGFLSANFLNGPRLTFALAEHADAPALFGRVHERFRTPFVSILVFTTLVWALAVYGNFEWNATLSAVARLFVYGSTCLSLLMLRRADPAGAAVRVPGGAVLAVLGIVLCGLLALQMGRAELVVLGAVTVLGVVHWFLVRNSANRDQAPA